MGVNIDAALVKRATDVEQLLGRGHPDAVVGAGVVPGPAHLRGESLDRSVEYHLQSGGTELLGVPILEPLDRVGCLGPIGRARGERGDVSLQDPCRILVPIHCRVPQVLRIGPLQPR